MLVSLEKPQQFMKNGPGVELLGRYRGNPSCRLNPHLVTENGTCTGTGTVLFIGTMFHDVAGVARGTVSSCGKDTHQQRVCSCC